MKKIFAIFLAVMMALALVVTPVLADLTAANIGYNDAVNSGSKYTKGLGTMFVGEKATFFVIASHTSAPGPTVTLTSSQDKSNVIKYDAPAAIINPATTTVATITALGIGEATATTKISTSTDTAEDVYANLTNILVKQVPVLKYNGTTVPSVLNVVSNANFDRKLAFTLEGTKGIDRNYKVELLANQANATFTSFNAANTNNNPMTLTAPSGEDAGVNIVIPKNASGLVTIALSFNAPGGNGSITPLAPIYFSINVTKSGGVPFTGLTIKDKADKPTVVGVDSEIALAGSGAPSNGDEIVYWISSNPAAVLFYTNPANKAAGTTAVYSGSIDDEPVAVAVGKGTATITLQNIAANVKDTYTVNVLDKAKPTDIVITNSKPTISAKNGELNLKAQVYPFNANQSVTWSVVVPSSLPTGWTLNSSTGKLESNSSALPIPGNIIIAQVSTVEDGANNLPRTTTVQINVTEHIAAGHVAVDALLTEVAVSGKLNMSAVVWDSASKVNKSSNQAVTWTVSDTALATIDSNGVLTGLKPGTVKVYATSNESGASGEKTIKVVNELTTDIWFVTSSELAVRARDDSTSAKLGTLKKADRVSYVSDNGVWAKIEYEGVEAFVARAHIAKAPTYAVSSFTLKVRSTKGAGKPEVDSNVVAVAKCAEEFVLLDEGTDGWAKVIYNNMLCFMFSNGGKNIKLSPLTASITSNTLKVRAAADTTSAQIGELVKGEIFTITGNTTVVVDGRNVNWYHINYGGTTAYVSSSYVAIK